MSRSGQKGCGTASPDVICVRWIITPHLSDPYVSGLYNRIYSEYIRIPLMYLLLRLFRGGHHNRREIIATLISEFILSNFKDFGQFDSVRPQAVIGNLSAEVIISDTAEFLRIIAQSSDEFRSRHIVINMRTADDILMLVTIPLEIGRSEGEVDFLGVAHGWYGVEEFVLGLEGGGCQGAGFDLCNSMRV